MDNFTHNGRTLYFTCHTGEVMSADKRSESRVFTAGGNLFQGPYIDTNVSTKQEFWVKPKNGNEVSVELTNWNIPIRTGQIVTMVSARTDDQVGLWALLINHSSGQYWTLRDGAKLRKLYRLGMDGATFIVLAIIYVGLWYAGMRWIDPHLPIEWVANSYVTKFCIGLFVFHALAWKMYDSTIEPSLNFHLRKIANASFASVASK